MIKVSIAENLEEVEKRISAAAKRSGRKREDITLVAVTKTHPAETVSYTHLTLPTIVHV